MARALAEAWAASARASARASAAPWGAAWVAAWVAAWRCMRRCMLPASACPWRPRCTCPSSESSYTAAPASAPAWAAPWVAAWVVASAWASARLTCDSALLKLRSRSHPDSPPSPPPGTGSTCAAAHRWLATSPRSWPAHCSRPCSWPGSTRPCLCTRHRRMAYTPAAVMAVSAWALAPTVARASAAHLT